ncbi:methyltransferase domain-containing protein [Streptomyces sp. NPDC058861]|uniref:methyltransferase domain-containing protein n=1 Tax=Streptomyces sp. NPDC058861 TaxID=3346653 RepID=UPI0036AF4175
MPAQRAPLRPAPVPVEKFFRRPYLERATRYRLAADRLATGGLSDRHSIADIGAGHTELDVCLRTEHGWRGRYLPVDRWTGTADLDTWEPPMRFDWMACLEVIEHLHDPARLVRVLQDSADHGVVITTPNPDVVDVLALDPTHITPVSREDLAGLGFYTSTHNLYGTDNDGICALWYRAGNDLVERVITPAPYEGGQR